MAALNNVGTTGSPLQFRSGLSLRSLSLLAVLCIILYVVGLTLYIGIRTIANTSNAASASRGIR